MVYGAGVVKQADTGPAGFALQNGTPVILSWTPPNDGQLHQVTWVTFISVASLETGGVVNGTYEGPNNAPQTTLLQGGGQAAGINAQSTTRVVEGGQAVTVTQASALTAGAATIWAQIWGS